MDATTAIETATKIADRALAPNAAKHDREASFPTEAIKELGSAGLMGLTIPTSLGGKGLGPRAFAGVVAALAEADASVGMIYVMHVMGTACIASAPTPNKHETVLRDIAAGKHLTTLAFSEKGSRSHFWAPISRATKNGDKLRVTAQKSFCTSAGHADSYVVTTLAADGKGPTDTTLYLVPGKANGVKTLGPWDGMGLRANASAAMLFEGVEVGPDQRVSDEGAGFKAKLEVVLPLFNLGSAAVALGICRAALKATIGHLKTTQFEHLGQSLGEGLPTLRAQLANMQMATDQLGAFIEDTINHLEKPDAATMLRVLEVKTVGAEAAIAVTSLAMRTCGGAAFAKHTGIERNFRDAHAGSVMSPTSDILREFMGKALLGIPLF
jgi:alkylation response protein AidB-like acyl-CoA dehydrogenase